MSSTFKIVVFYSSERQGWSETYYMTAANSSAVYSVMSPGFINARMLLASAPTTMLAFRISDTANYRSSQLFPVGGGTGYMPPPNQYESESDQPFNACLMRLYSVGPPNVQRPLYLRGNPDSAFDLSSPNNADAQAFGNNYQNFAAFLQANGFNIRYKVKPIFPTPGGPAATVTPISGWATTSPSSSSVLTTPMGYVFPTPIPPFLTIYRLKGLPTTPGLVEVLGLTGAPTPVGYTVRFRTPQDYSYPGGGFFLAASWSYPAITNIAQQFTFNRRATGRPFDVERGRRRAIAR